MLSGAEPANAPTLQPPGFAVDASMVQRFLTEGYIAFRPAGADAGAILEALREMTPPIVASAEAGKALGDDPHVPGYAPSFGAFRAWWPGSRRTANYRLQQRRAQIPALRKCSPPATSSVRLLHCLGRISSWMRTATPTLPRLGV